MNEKPVTIYWDNAYPKKIVIDGDITHSNCLHVKSEIDRCFASGTKQKDYIAIDCSKLVTLDSSGLGVLTNLYMVLQRMGVKLYLTGLHGQPKKLITFLNINHFFKEDNKCHLPSALQNA